MSEALGLESGCVTVVAYDPRWPHLFEDAAAEIRGALGDRIVGIEHVGSTAVIGMAAKPILDMLASVADFEGSLQLLPELAELGYHYAPEQGIPDRHYLRRSLRRRRTHHLSLAVPASTFHRRTIAFRDALRADRRLASDYQALKLDLANRFPNDREAYLDGKTEFVLAALRACGAAD